MDRLPGRVLPAGQGAVRLFRRLFVEALEKAFDAGELRFFAALDPLRERDAFRRHLAPVRRAKWVVYAKPPFAGPDQVLDYVGRYTHRVALSNDRLLDIEDGKVRFRWKDYRQGSRQKTMTLDADEFIRRFPLHVLPDRFPSATTACSATAHRGETGPLPRSCWACRNPSLTTR